MEKLVMRNLRKIVIAMFFIIGILLLWAIGSNKQTVYDAVPEQTATVQVEPPKVAETPVETPAVQPIAVVEPAKEPVKQVTWRDNPNGCNTDTQYIWASDFSCHDKPVAKPVAKPTSNKTVSTAPTSGGSTGNCGDNIYKQYIYKHESGCRTTALNSIGCYGIGQSCPASKIAHCGADFACQDAWFSNYAQSRYGGWEKAYQFWVANRWW